MFRRLPLVNAFARDGGYRNSTAVYRWRKLKGTAVVELADGRMCHAELHWYEAHGIGAREYKIKRILEIQ